MWSQRAVAAYFLRYQLPPFWLFRAACVPGVRWADRHVWTVRKDPRALTFLQVFSQVPGALVRYSQMCPPRVSGVRKRIRKQVEKTDKERVWEKTAADRYHMCFIRGCLYITGFNGGGTQAHTRRLYQTHTKERSENKIYRRWSSASLSWPWSAWWWLTDMLVTMVTPTGEDFRQCEYLEIFAKPKGSICLFVNQADKPLLFFGTFWSPNEIKWMGFYAIFVHI